MEWARVASEGAVVGSWYFGVGAIPSLVSTLVRSSLRPCFVIAVKPTSTTKKGKYEVKNTN